MTTHAPSAARRAAIARPMPLAAPVTKAIAAGVRRRRRQPLQLRPPRAPSTRCGTSRPRRSVRSSTMASAPRITLMALT